MSDEPKPWAQLPGEPDEAYARFLIYRNLGPTRNLNAAYQASGASKRNKSASGQWREDCQKYEWRERTAKWDVEMLSQVVPETAAYIFESIKQLARITLEELNKGKKKPRTWSELKESVIVLAQFVSPEVITAAIDHAADDGAEAEAETGEEA